MGWDLGVARDHLRDLVAYWADGYDWRRHEARLNALPQGTTEVDGQLLHYLHVASPNPHPASLPPLPPLPPHPPRPAGTSAQRSRQRGEAVGIPAAPVPARARAGPPPPWGLRRSPVRARPGIR
ncbi:epoxide hydrolase N-terminal domain-containing protein [Catenulispora subtropica]|uniref:epoxide hydrolase N-terminal domain-containing protein n=1 Tax=Catenulispora subtropica TaxID=450798 RepID=UPI003CD0B402